MGVEWSIRTWTVVPAFGPQVLLYRHPVQKWYARVFMYVCMCRADPGLAPRALSHSRTVSLNIYGCSDAYVRVRERKRARASQKVHELGCGGGGVRLYCVSASKYCACVRLSNFGCVHDLTSLSLCLFIHGCHILYYYTKFKG